MLFGEDRSGAACRPGLEARNPLLTDTPPLQVNDAVLDIDEDLRGTGGAVSEKDDDRVGRAGAENSSDLLCSPGTIRLDDARGLISLVVGDDGDAERWRGASSSGLEGTPANLTVLYRELWKRLGRLWQTSTESLGHNFITYKTHIKS